MTQPLLPSPLSRPRFHLGRASAGRHLRESIPSSVDSIYRETEKLPPRASRELRSETLRKAETGAGARNYSSRLVVFRRPARALRR